MGTSKKNIEAMQKNLAALDKRIGAREQQLRRDKEQRRKLLTQIAAAQASELMGIVSQRELTFEQAKDILAKAEKFTEKEETEHE